MDGTGKVVREGKVELAHARAGDALRSSVPFVVSCLHLAEADVGALKGPSDFDPQATWNACSLGHIVGARKQRWCDRQPQCLRGLEVDREFECCRLDENGRATNVDVLSSSASRLHRSSDALSHLRQKTSFNARELRRRLDITRPVTTMLIFRPRPLRSGARATA
jgi:hypothetical protein